MNKDRESEGPKKGITNLKKKDAKKNKPVDRQKII